jgi:anti-sigma factor RsiW
MSDEGYNPDDPLFALSRSLDEKLPEGERRRMDEALAASEALRAEAESLRATDRLVKRWASAAPELDWGRHAALIEAQAPDDDSEELNRLDRLLERWGRTVPPLDEGSFTAAVMARVRSERRRAARSSLLYRIGAPLAAAAAVAIAITGSLWLMPSGEPITHVVYVSTLSTDPVDEDRPSVSMVSFVRRPVEPAEITAPAGLSFGSVGSAAEYVSDQEMLPL